MAGWAAGEAGAVRSGLAGSVAGAATEAQGVDVHWEVTQMVTGS